MIVLVEVINLMHKCTTMRRCDYVLTESQMGGCFKREVGQKGAYGIGDGHVIRVGSSET